MKSNDTINNKAEKISRLYRELTELLEQAEAVANKQGSRVMLNTLYEDHEKLSDLVRSSARRA
jgi:hypothetical protein